MFVSSGCCLYVKICNVPIGDTEKYLANIVRDACDHIDARDLVWKLNIPSVDARERHCFLWVNRKDVFNTLLGKSPEGLTISQEKQNLFEMDWGDPYADVEKFVVPKYSEDSSVIFTPATFKRVDEEYCEGKIFCNTILLDHTVKEIKQMFKPFVTKGSVFVTKNARGNSYISFENVSDAYFALCMMHKNTRDEIPLSLSYARK